MLSKGISVAASVIFGATVIASASVANATLPGAGDRGSTGMDEPTISVGRLHVMRPRTFGAARIRHDLTGQLPYNGGLVQLVPKIYLIFWGFQRSGDPSGEKTYLTNFMNGVGGSSWLNTVTQYYDNSGNITNPGNQLAGSWSYSGKVPSSPSDSQIQAVAERGVKHFGFNANATYFVMTPTNHNSSGFGTQYCAYHGAFRNTSGNTVAYTNMPYITDAGQNCGENFINPGSAGLLDGVSVVGGHEQAEAITDPNPPTGWSGNQGEIGDLCAWASNSTDITLSTGTFAVQPLWSDAANNCVTSS